MVAPISFKFVLIPVEPAFLLDYVNEPDTSDEIQHAKQINKKKTVTQHNGNYYNI